MPINPHEFATPGKIVAVNGDSVVFAPRGTTYEIHLKTATPYQGPTNTPVEVVIRVTARKVWTVPSGGNFIAPIVGSPRIIQGRVRQADEKQLVVHAAAAFIVDLPAADHAVDLPSGPIAVGQMVNVTALPGASMEIHSAAAAMPAAAE